MGAVLGRTHPPAAAAELARRLEQAGADSLWVIEDCFYTAAPSLAASALAVTSRLRVGVGIVPAVARTAAVTAMEFATLAGLGPGRLIAGVGHGVQEWMGQMGVRPASPLTALDETLTAVRALLRGERVSLEGRYVHLDGVALEQPPDPVPPVLAGVRGPRSLALAGRAADGLLLAEPATPAYVRAARDAAGSGDAFAVHVFTAFAMDEDRSAARRAWAGDVGAWLAAANPGLAALPFHAELHERWETGGTSALVDMPDAWWLEIGAVGTAADVRGHLERLADAGAAGAALLPPSDTGVAVARKAVDDLAGLLAG